METPVGAAAAGCAGLAGADEAAGAAGVDGVGAAAVVGAVGGVGSARGAGVGTAGSAGAAGLGLTGLSLGFNFSRCGFGGGNGAGVGNGGGAGVTAAGAAGCNCGLDGGTGCNSTTVTGGAGLGGWLVACSASSPRTPACSNSEIATATGARRNVVIRKARALAACPAVGSSAGPAHPACHITRSCGWQGSAQRAGYRAHRSRDSMTYG